LKCFFYYLWVMIRPLGRGICGGSYLVDFGEIDNLFKVGGGGRKRKLENVEETIIAEIEKNDYHSHQQIADMIQEKHGIKVSLKSVERLLKKTKSNA